MKEVITLSLTVGEKIKRYRLEKGMTQEELGKELGVGRAAVQKYGSNQVQNLVAFCYFKKTKTSQRCLQWLKQSEWNKK